MAKLKALLLTEGHHGMISQAEGLAKALKTEFHHKIVRLNWLWNYVPAKLTPISEIILKDKRYITEAKDFDLVCYPQEKKCKNIYNTYTRSKNKP